MANEEDAGIEEGRGAPGDTMVATPQDEGQSVEEEAGEKEFEIDESEFATPRQIGDIKDQLLDRYIAKEITEEQLKNMLTEFAKKHNLNIKLSKSNGRLQVRIGKRKTAQFKREPEEITALEGLSNKNLSSDCCKEKDRMLGPDGPSYSDLKICPKCKAYCEFVDS